MEKTPVIVLNGFLGSGKTTLFRNLLAQCNKQKKSVCAIVNDMSELDIDGELIANTTIVERNGKTMESISSHVLSSKIGIQKLDDSIKKLLTNNTPEIVIVETSGSCHPMPVIKYFQNQDALNLTGFFVLLDSLMITHDYENGKMLIPNMQQNMVQGKRGTINLLIEQILFCSHLIITKSDRINKSELENIISHVQEINQYASITPITFGNLSIESIFDLNNYNYFNIELLLKELEPIIESEENSDRPYDIATIVINDDRPFHPKRLWEICHQHLDKRIYRSKGFFWLASRDNNSLLWNQAAGGISLEIIGTWKIAIVEDKNNGLLKDEIMLLEELLKNEPGRFGDRCCDLTIIGDKDHVNEFTEKLKSCFLTKKEILQWKNGRKFDDPWPKNIVRVNH